MTTQDLRQLLDAHVEEVAERDFADLAWSGAVARQQRRRTVVAGGLAAAVAAAVAVATVPALRGAESTPATRTPSVTTTSTAPRVAFVGRDGTPFVLGGDQASLRASQVATKIPPQDLRIPAAPKDLRAVVDPADPSMSLVVVAVGSRQVGEADQSLLFLLDPVAGFTWVTVDLRLESLDPVNGGSGIQPGGISPDGHTVVFVQPHELVVLDARTAQVRRVSVAGANAGMIRLEAGGFAPDGSYVTWGYGDTFTLAKGGDRLVRAGSGTRPDAWTIESKPSATGSEAVLVHQGSGAGPQTSGWKDVGTGFEPLGPSASGSGWVARGGFPDTDLMPAGEERVSGLLAVSQDGGRRKVLVMDEDTDGQMKGGLSAVAFLDWTEHPTVVFRYYSPRGDTLGAWDLVTDDVMFVSRLDEPTSETGRGGVVAVSPRTSWIN